MLENILPEAYRTDDDCSCLVWLKNRKMLSIHLNVYGSPPTIRCGLTSPPGGNIIINNFESGWAWFCDENEILPNL